MPRDSQVATQSPCLSVSPLPGHLLPAGLVAPGALIPTEKEIVEELRGLLQTGLPKLMLFRSTVRMLLRDGIDYDDLAVAMREVSGFVLRPILDYKTGPQLASAWSELSAETVVLSGCRGTHMGFRCCRIARRAHERCTHSSGTGVLVSKTGNGGSKTYLGLEHLWGRVPT